VLSFSFKREALARWQRLSVLVDKSDTKRPLCRTQMVGVRGGRMDESSLAQRWAPHLLSALRIVSALLLIEHGTQKLFGFPGPPANFPAVLSLLWWQAIIEIVGGLLLLAGLFTRLVAFVLAGDMAVAYWMVHAPKSFYPVLNGGDAAVLFCFVFLYIAAAGGGPWSLDRRFLSS
jgi:putative oxidoreductase